MQTKFLACYAWSSGLPDKKKNNPCHVFQWTWFPFDITWPPAYCETGTTLNLTSWPRTASRSPFSQQISGPHVENPPCGSLNKTDRLCIQQEPFRTDYDVALLLLYEKVIKVHSSVELQAASESRYGCGGGSPADG